MKIKKQVLDAMASKMNSIGPSAMMSDFPAKCVEALIEIYPTLKYLLLDNEGAADIEDLTEMESMVEVTLERRSAILSGRAIISEEEFRKEISSLVRIGDDDTGAIRFIKEDIQRDLNRAASLILGEKARLKRNK